MRLIGLAGQKQSGKSTIATMIVIEKQASLIAFADPMKEFVSLLFGWSREDLEDGAFKERPDERYPRPSGRVVFPYTPEGSAWIVLGGGRGYTLVDIADLGRVSERSWQRSNKGEGHDNTDYAKTDFTCEENGGERGTIPLHRFITKCPPDKEVDHINGDGLDNRRINLRICSHAENHRNLAKRAPETASSPFKGVCWDAERGKWMAKILADGHTKFLGRFDSGGEAAVAYDIEAEKIFGEFARLNRNLFLTPRYALQQLGTQLGRGLYENIWVDYALRKAKSLDAGPQTWILLTDTRFPNEAKAIRDAGGEVWRINRPRGGSENDPHPSEQGIFSPEMDKYVTREILNSGSLADLKLKIMDLING